MPEKPSLGFQRLKAQRLRTNATEAEKLLWRHLRRLEISGSHFRRQVPIGPYKAFERHGSDLCRDLRLS